MRCPYISSTPSSLRPIHPQPTTHPKFSTEEFGVIPIARRSQDIVGNNMPNGPPCKDVHYIEAHWIIGLEQASVLLRPGVPGLEMGLPVLLRQPLLRDVLPLEVEEHEPAQEEGEARAEADDEGRAELGPDGDGPDGGPGRLDCGRPGPRGGGDAAEADEGVGEVVGGLLDGGSGEEGG